MNTKEFPNAKVTIESPSDGPCSADRRRVLTDAIVTLPFSPKVVMSSIDHAEVGSDPVRSQVAWTPDLPGQSACELVIAEDLSQEQVLRFLTFAKRRVKRKFSRLKKELARARAQGRPQLLKHREHDDEAPF